jgi:multicomponent Na+:H+ antiporter subunit B
MTTSLILKTGVKLLLPLMLLFSLFILWRGHHQPGGGFVGGLIAAIGIGLHAQAFGMPAARRLLRFDPQTIAGIGLLVALTSGMFGLAAGAPYMTGQWLRWPFEAGGVWFGTPVLFDIGVYCVVLGGVLSMVAALMSEED